MLLIEAGISFPEVSVPQIRKKIGRDYNEAPWDEKIWADMNSLVS